MAEAGNSEHTLPSLPRPRVRLLLGFLRRPDRDVIARGPAVPDDLPDRVDLHHGHAGRGAAAGGFNHGGIQASLW